MNNQNRDPQNIYQSIVDEQRVVLIDITTNRYIGILENSLKLLGDASDSSTKPFFLKVKLPYLPRINEYIKLPNVDKPLLVKNIVHEFIMSNKIPSYALLFVNYVPYES